MGQSVNITELTPNISVTGYLFNVQVWTNSARTTIVTDKQYYVPSYQLVVVTDVITTNQLEISIGSGTITLNSSDYSHATYNAGANMTLAGVGQAIMSALAAA